jgi:chemotaxis protein CheC
MFGNLLDVHVSFSVPRLHLETLDELLASLNAGGGDEPQYALVIYTAFQIRDSAVRGFLVMVLSVTSLDRLIQEVEAWEERQGRS